MASSLNQVQHHLQLAEEWGSKVWCPVCKITFDSPTIASKIGCGEDVTKLDPELLSRLSGYEIKKEKEK